MIKSIFIASMCNSICTGIITSILWLAMSRDSLDGVLTFVVIVVINGFLSAVITSFMQDKFERFPLVLSMYLGNTIPICAFLLFYWFFITADQTDGMVDFFFHLCLIGWLIISIIPTVITSRFVAKYTHTK